MKFNKLFFGRTKNKIGILLMITLMVFGSIAPKIIKADTVTSNLNSDSFKILAATKTADKQVTSDVVTQFDSPMQDTTSTNKTTLLNSLISPLTVYNRVTTGEVNVNGYYLQADIGFLFSTVQNDINVGNTITLSLKSINPKPLGIASSWSIQRNKDKPVSSSKVGKTAKLSGYGDTITMTSDKTATLVGSSTQTNNLYKYIPSNGYIMITAQVTNNMPALLDLRLGSVMDSSDYAMYIDINTLMHFNIREDIFDQVYTAMKNYSRPELKNFQITGLTLHWRRDYRKKDFNEKKPIDISDDVIDMSNGYDPSNLKFEYLFYKQVDPINDSVEYPFTNGVYAQLVLDYTYKSGFVFPTTKSEQLITNFGGFTVIPAVTPTIPDNLPDIKLDNELHNLTNHESDSQDPNEKNLVVKNVKKDDLIQYTANLNSTYDNTGTNTGTISKGIYTVPIPKEMDVDTNSFKFTNNSNVVNTVDSSRINVTTDPDDNTKKILTVNDLTLDPEGMADSQFNLVFNGTITDDHQDDFTFTPTFKGVGGYENGDNSKPMFVDATGNEQLINFDNAVEPGGGVTLSPSHIDFGFLNSFVNKDTLKHRVKNDNSPILSIQDDRSDTDKSSQTISVQQKGQLSNGDTEFPGDLRFYNPNSSTGEFTSLLTGNLVPIYVSANGETLSSISWADNKGLLLHINDGNKSIPAGQYSTTLDWTISDTL